VLKDSNRMVTTSDRETAAQSRPLDPSEFSFHGFGELRFSEQRKIERLNIREGEPSVSFAENAIFIPHGQPGLAGEAKVFGGVVSADGQPIDTAQTNRKGGKRLAAAAAPGTVTPEREIDEEVVFLGPLFNHYGRVLLESLARVWYLDRVDPAVNVVFSYANAAQAAIPGWLPPILTAFGIPRERILVLDEPTRLGRAIVPEPLFEQLFSVHSEMIRPFRDVAARVAGDVQPSQQPLYLSRRLLSSRQRPVIGEAELEDVLRDNGFLVAYPETMSFADQVRLINAHSDIFSCIGSAAHSVLFALHRPRLHLLTSRDDLPANYFLCSALAETPTTFVNALSSGGRKSPHLERRLRRLGSESGDGGEAAERPVEGDAGQQATPELADMPRVAGYLEERGFLRNRLRAALAARSPAMQARFDEAWLYSRLRKGSAKSGSLPAAIEDEATRVATRSWPVSLMLARYYARERDAPRTEALARQFVALVASEQDIGRLAFYYRDVESAATRIVRLCGPETARALSVVLADRFLIGARESGADASD
jgi:hypothetical protein